MPLPSDRLLRRSGALAATLLALACLAAPAHAQAPSSCEEHVRAWARRCPVRQAICIQPVLCPPGSVLLEAGCHEDERLRVEVSRATSRAFRKVGEVGLSPVGDFPDWSRVAEGKRRILDRIADCLSMDPSLLPAASPAPGPPSSAPPPADVPVPWRLLLGLSLGLFACLPRARAAARRTLPLLCALFAATLLLRLLAFPLAFFHPNGQGAFWIGFALDPNGLLSSYGPGYHELFGWLAQLPFATPERLVMGAQAVAGAASAACAWILGREIGGRPLAWAGAAAVATSPILARISHSQSYHGTWASLLLLAAAVLVLGAPRPGERARRFAVAVAAAGLLVAQAARVTPIGWMPAAVLPLVLLARPGPLRKQLVFTIAAALGIGLVVAAASGPAMLAVLRGSLGAQWLPHVRPAGLESPHAPWLLLVLLLLALASRPRGPAALRALALAGTLALVELTCLVRSDPEPFQRAYSALWAPVLLALAAALAAGLRTAKLRLAAATALLAGALALSARTWRADSELPTNVLEALWAEEWRARLPPGSTVVYLGRVRPHVLALPLYGAHTRVRVEPFVLSHGDPLPDTRGLAPPIYYYESSLCAAPEVRDMCRELRDGLRLEPIETRTLPARSSGAASFFEDVEVRVTLYRAR